MRLLPLILLFLLAYIEIIIFIKVANVFGVFLTLLLVIFTSMLGISLVRQRGLANLMVLQQKMTEGENPQQEMIKSMSLALAGLLLIIPGFFTDFLGLLLLLPAVQKMLLLKLMPHIRVYGMKKGQKPHHDNGRTIDGEFERKDDRDKW